MKKLSKIAIIVLAMLTAISVIVPPAAEAAEGVAFGGGTGTAADPYVITTADQLNEVRSALDKHYVLAADIDLSTSAYASGWTPIGRVGGSDEYFTGTFDGQSHTIAGLYIESDAAYIGLFGRTSTSAAITDLTLVGAAVTNMSGSYTGALVGRNEGHLSGIAIIDGTVTGYAFTGLAAGGNAGTIAESQVIGGAVVGFQDNGGLVGTNNGSLTGNLVRNTSVTGTSPNTGTTGGLVGKNNPSGIVERNAYLSTTAVVKGAGTPVGGLIGSNYGTVRYGYAEGQVGIAGTGNRIGGLVGSIENGIIEDSYARTTVEGQNRLGGLAGYHAADATISRAYAVADFPSTSGGGLIGQADGAVNDSFWHRGNGASAAFLSGASSSVVGELDAEQLADPSFFTSAGWDFADTWLMAEGERAPSLAAWLGNMEASVDGVSKPLYFTPYRYDYRLNVPHETALVGITVTKRSVTDTVYIDVQPANTVGVVMPLTADYLEFQIVVYRDGQSKAYAVHVYRSSPVEAIEADRSELEAAIEAAALALAAAEEGSGAGQYAAVDIATFEAAIGAAEAVYADAAASQTEVDEAVAALEAASAAFADAAVEVDRSELEMAIALAAITLEEAEEGTGAGQYTAVDIAMFEAAIGAAYAVYADEAASQAELDEAVQTLLIAWQAFSGSAVGAVLTFAEEIVEAGQSYLLLTFNLPLSGEADASRFALQGAGNIAVTDVTVASGDDRLAVARLTDPLPASGAVTIAAQPGAVAIAEGIANPAASEIAVIRYVDTLALRQQLLAQGTASDGEQITIAHVASHADAFLADMEPHGIDRILLLRYLLRQIEPA